MVLTINEINRLNSSNDLLDRCFSVAESEYFRKIMNKNYDNSFILSIEGTEIAKIKVDRDYYYKVRIVDVLCDLSLLKEMLIKFRNVSISNPHYKGDFESFEKIISLKLINKNKKLVIS